MRYETTLSNLTGSRMELRRGKEAIYDKVADIEAGGTVDYSYKDRGQTYIEYQCCFYPTDVSIPGKSGMIQLTSQDFVEFKKMEFNTDDSGTKFSWKGAERRPIG